LAIEFLVGSVKPLTNGIIASNNEYPQANKEVLREEQHEKYDEDSLWSLQKAYRAEFQKVLCFCLDIAYDQGGYKG
jgi:hypothetical protein